MSDGMTAIAVIEGVGSLVGRHFASVEVIDVDTKPNRFSHGLDVRVSLRCACGRRFSASRTAFAQGLIEKCPACGFRE